MRRKGKSRQRHIKMIEKKTACITMCGAKINHESVEGQNNKQNEDQ